MDTVNTICGVSWKQGANQFVAKLGYKLNKAGERIRSSHYLGRDEGQAHRAFFRLQDEWRAIVEQARQNGVKPIWPCNPADLRQTPQNAPGDRPVPSTTPKITLSEAKDLWLAHYRQKTNLIGDRGIKVRSFLSIQKNINSAFRGLPQATLKVASITLADIDGIINYWFHKDRGISERTAQNYVKAIQQCLDWAVGHFGIPRLDYGKRFTFSRVPKGKIEAFNATRLIACLNAGSERTRLFGILCLNIGGYAIDVESLRHDELVRDDGGKLVAIARKRSKTSHQNDFVVFHKLWPETVELLEANLAPANPHGLALLNSHGAPLRHDGPTQTVSNVAQDWCRATADLDNPYVLKQLRKLGVSAIHRITRNPDVARKYAGKQCDASLAGYALDEDYTAVTEALAKWRDELKRDGVL